MREAITRGIICIDDPTGKQYRVSKIQYLVREDDSFEYIFTPDYSVIDSLPKSAGFQGIPGLDLTLRKSQYIRKDRIPVFISERSPQKNREDLWELLQKYDMDYLNSLEWLIRTDMQYCGDTLYVIRDDAS